MLSQTQYQIVLLICNFSAQRFPDLQGNMDLAYVQRPRKIELIKLSSDDDDAIEAAADAIELSSDDDAAAARKRADKITRRGN